MYLFPCEFLCPPIGGYLRCSLWVIYSASTNERNQHKQVSGFGHSFPSLYWCSLTSIMTKPRTKLKSNVCKLCVVLFHVNWKTMRYILPVQILLRKVNGMLQTQSVTAVILMRGRMGPAGQWLVRLSGDRGWGPSNLCDVTTVRHYYLPRMKFTNQSFSTACNYHLHKTW
jgi:hypothetical protein